MKYKRLEKDKATNVEIGTWVNFGNGKIGEVIGFSESKYKVSTPQNQTPHAERLVVVKIGENMHEYYPVALCGATTESMDVALLKCEYCGDIMDASDALRARIRLNRQWHEGTYCKDKPCHGYAQMSAEG